MTKEEKIDYMKRKFTSIVFEYSTMLRIPFDEAKKQCLEILLEETKKTDC